MRGSILLALSGDKYTSITVRDGEVRGSILLALSGDKYTSITVRDGEAWGPYCQLCQGTNTQVLQ